MPDHKLTVYEVRGVSGGWPGWAIAHPVFGRIEGAAGRQRQATILRITDCPPSIS